VPDVAVSVDELGICLDTLARVAAELPSTLDRSLFEVV
jgi:hypothetical protein